MKRKAKNIGPTFKKELLLKAELTFQKEHAENWIFLEPIVGAIKMSEFGYPLDQFKDFEILVVGTNNVKILHLDTTFILDLKTVRTFGEIVKRKIDGEIAYGCMQITISLQ